MDRLSSKVTQSPGGNSNFSFGWTNNSTPSAVQGKKQFVKENAVGGGVFNHPQGAERIPRKFTQTPGGNETWTMNDSGKPQVRPKSSKRVFEKVDNMFKDTTDSHVNSSIRVNNPPGGRSNFKLG